MYSFVSSRRWDFNIQVFMYYNNDNISFSNVSGSHIHSPHPTPYQHHIYSTPIPAPGVTPEWIVVFRKPLLATYTEPQPASVARLDERPTGEQEVAGSTPARSATFVRGDLTMKYFLRSFIPFRWFKKGICQFLAKKCVHYWLTA